MTSTTIPEFPVSRTEEIFFDTHADDLYDLFVALGRTAEWRDNVEDLLPYTQEKWVGQEHGNSADKDQFTAEQEAAAQAPLERLGLCAGVLPPAGFYEQAVILGGLQRANRRRADYMEKLLARRNVTTEQIVFWAGQRLRGAKDDDQVNQMDLTAFSSDPWLRDELARPPDTEWGSRFATETELARLALLESTFPHRPRLSRISTEMRLPGRTIAGIPHPGVTQYRFSRDNRPDFVLLNCPAVERARGLPRPTLESQTPEWLQRLTPSQGADILVVAGSPHMARNIRDIRRVARENGREDINFSICGTAVNRAAPIQLYLGELGRLFYMDAADKAVARALVTA